MGVTFEAAELPDGRIELRLGTCVPVVLSLETYAAHSRQELLGLLKMLNRIALCLEQQDCLLPIGTGRFVEDESRERFVLRPPGPVGVFDTLSVPAEIAFE